MKTKILLIGLIIFLVNVISVNAQVIKYGSCPSGWSAGKCPVPHSTGFL